MFDATANAYLLLRRARVGLRTGLALAAVALALSFAMVPPAAAQNVPPLDKPFAEHKLALQLSDNDPKKESLVISVAYNLLKFYGPDKVAIEVVAFGPGIDLLKADNANRALVDSLVAQGVRFDVCGNTLDTIARESGKRPDINPRAVEVEAGVAQLLTLAETGYTIVRP
ncbi:DsrE family protein [Bradyrhizobium sp. 2TAF24]|uniref:DsrE family protein n=1 Tax=Bradyrhizobium sp. 2TAF24 TaxID=3233011 RepID=UPI003F8F6F69